MSWCGRSATPGFWYSDVLRQVVLDEVHWRDVAFRVPRSVFRIATARVCILFEVTPRTNRANADRGPRNAGLV